MKGYEMENENSFDQSTANYEDFWELIHESRLACGDDVDLQVAWLKGALTQKSLEDIIRFECQIKSLHGMALCPDVWEAVVQAWGGCSDDSMHYLCAWIISQGKEFFAFALSRTDMLSIVLEAIGLETASAECLMYVAYYAYEERTGGADLWAISRG